MEALYLSGHLYLFRAFKIFNILTDLFSWISQQRGVTFVMNYLLFIGQANSPSVNATWTSLHKLVQTTMVSLQPPMLPAPVVNNAT